MSNLAFIFSSALNAFIILSPPNVSSTWLMVSLHRLCARMLLALSFLPTKPMNHVKMGAKIIVKIVSCHDMTINVTR